ncbi:MAG: beta-lactamase family protein [Deltaproteobacteria bacterium]|jgi:CubicO group peptidase (beta-lactamase class C family)|nr:beta-lactamase family protein [Deltaproteobacteria bacterium]
MTPKTAGLAKPSQGEPDGAGTTPAAPIQAETAPHAPDRAETGQAASDQAKAAHVDRLLAAAVAAGVFPGCVLVWGRPVQGFSQMACAGTRGLTRGRIPVEPSLLYDLASLTKILSTTSLLMRAVDQGLAALSTRLGALDWPLPPDLSQLTLLDLLTHQSGLPSWRPYHQNPELREPARLKAAILSERPLFRPQQMTLYSDLNFLLLGLFLTEVFGVDLATLFRREVADTLGLRRLGFCPAGDDIAPAEDGPRLGGPLSWPAAPVLGPTPLGRPHDDNAAFLGGAAGHAGLFGSAAEIWRVVVDWAAAEAEDAGRLVRQDTLRDFLKIRTPAEGPGRGAGFDIGLGPLLEARGHLAYTGCSLWWSPETDQAFALLCNRVHPTARGSRMEAFRRELAELLWRG